MISIYELRFPSGKYYIGQSKDPEKRMYTHWHKPENARLVVELAKYDSWEDVDLIIIRSFQTKAKANEFEAQRIADHMHDPKCLNKQYGPGGIKGGRKYPHRVPGGKLVRCRICRLWKGARCFHSDRSRSSGIASACKQCKNRVGTAIGKAKSDVVRKWTLENREMVKAIDRAGSDAYHATVAEIRGED